MKCTHSETWRKEKIDPLSVPATTPMRPDSRRNFRVHGGHNIMITPAVLMDPDFFPLIHTIYKYAI